LAAGLIGALAGCLVWLATGAHAAVIKPSVLFDQRVRDNGNCTLREAIVAANEDRRVDRCRRGRGADVIRLQRGT
jgi:CSLREA domain-containing protein